jgi:hypothetical protein
MCGTGLSGMSVQYVSEVKLSQKVRTILMWTIWGIAVLLFDNDNICYVKYTNV